MTLHQARVLSSTEGFTLKVSAPTLYGDSIVEAAPALRKDTGEAVPSPGEVVWVSESTAGLVWLGVFASPGDDVGGMVGSQGRWEVVLTGSPPEPVTNDDNDDWLYAWVGA